MIKKRIIDRVLDKALELFYFKVWCRSEKKMEMKKVILESPFAGEVERNIKYARLCMRDCLMRGESPYASHLLYTQKGVLDDLISEERTLGINAGFEWRSVADYTVVYYDYGISKGMEYGIKNSIKHLKTVEYRKLKNLEEMMKE